MILVLVLVGVIASADPAEDVVVRNSGGVRVTRNAYGQRYEITTRNAARIARIAASDDDANVRYAAVMALADRTLLADLSRTASDQSVRAVALERISTPTRPAAEVAREERLFAVARLDPARVAILARHDPSAEIRLAAVGRVEDQGLLADIAAYDPVASVRLAAIRSLSDESLLAGLARDSLVPEVRAAAARRREHLLRNSPKPLRR